MRSLRNIIFIGTTCHQNRKSVIENSRPKKDTHIFWKLRDIVEKSWQNFILYLSQILLVVIFCFRWSSWRRKSRIFNQANLLAAGQGMKIDPYLYNYQSRNVGHTTHKQTSHINRRKPQNLTKFPDCLLCITLSLPTRSISACYHFN